MDSQLISQFFTVVAALESGSSKTAMPLNDVSLWIKAWPDLTIGSSNLDWPGFGSVTDIGVCFSL